MADIKTLQTRIALKYDTYANWIDEAKGANLVLLKGEIGICEIPSGDANATTAPTVLFKVGDGTTPFKGLKWASALAADVYGWAKAATVALEDKKLNFKSADGTVISFVDLSSFATGADTADLADRLTNVEAAIGVGGGDGGNSVADQIADLIKAVDDEAKARADADTAISEKIGGEFTKDNTVAAAISEAKSAATNAANAVDELSKGQVANNKADIAKLTGDIATETTARTNADSALDTRLQKIEAFFAGADGDGIDNGVKDALDTLLEIQNIITSDGAAADEMLEAITNNSNAIAELAGVVGDANSGIVKSVADANANIADLTGRATTAEGEIDDIQAIVNGANGNDTLRAAITALETLTGDASNGNEKLRSDLNAVMSAVNNETTGLVATKAIADEAKSAANANAGKIAAIEADYLKQADYYVFQCGSASEVTHTIPTN